MARRSFSLVFGRFHRNLPSGRRFEACLTAQYGAGQRNPLHYYTLRKRKKRRLGGLSVQREHSPYPYQLFSGLRYTSRTFSPYIGNLNGFDACNANILPIYRQLERVSVYTHGAIWRIESQPLHLYRERKRVFRHFWRKIVTSPPNERRRCVANMSRFRPVSE